MQILDITPENVDELGFFCYMSKRKSEGYRRKLAWVKQQFENGLRIKMLAKPDRGFIEYIPGEHAWRAVNASGYMLIHCLWVVGKSKKQGYAKALLEACIEDARASGMHGVAMVTSEGNWLLSKKFLALQGLECVDEAEPSFSLMVKRFDDAELPSFPTDWAERAAKYGNGLTVIRTGQCPYIPDAAATAASCAEQVGVPCNELEYDSPKEAQAASPTPYGTFGMVKDGTVLSYCYQLEKDLLPMLKGETT